MKRIEIAPREGWQAIVETEGLTWHSEGGSVTWNERAAYQLSRTEARQLYQSASEMAVIYQQAAAHVIKRGLWTLIGLKEHEAKLITASWEKGEWSLHGRFDFLFDAEGCPKALEYNAETALSLVETAVIQKHWASEVMPDWSQFNELEESLATAWRESKFKHVHCSWRPRHAEIEGTMRYMAKLMRRSGIEVTLMALHRMGWDSRSHKFVDQDGQPITHCYKIYPWEWMLREPFVRHVASAGCSFIEPPWRLLLGSKGILKVISDMFGDHPAVVACHNDSAKLGSTYVAKPLFGHEGHNVEIHRDGRIVESLSGEYSDEPKVYQSFVESARCNGFLPQFGVWMVQDKPAAICVRETSGSIISANSPFVPHVAERT